MGMKVGMLWFDDSSQPLTERINRAVAYYREKYGHVPTHCVVHPSTLGEEGEQVINGVALFRAASVMPNHFWIGIDSSAGSASMPHSRAA
jgi:hypothetical protein